MTTPTPPSKAKAAKQPPPFRQIRANHDADTITVYQAYNAAIATAAVRAQRLDASPQFRTTRMTWIKPSWAWMLYRAGYSFKDPGQERILALRMRHADFVGLLERAVLTTHEGAAAGTAAASGGKQEEDSAAVAAAAAAAAAGGGTGTASSSSGKAADAPGLASGDGVAPTKSADVKVQWDPERTVRLEKLEYRSIQIGIPAALSAKWVSEWIVGIEDVTAKARELKAILDRRPDVSDEELDRLGLVPKETPFELPESLQRKLRMI